MRTYCRIVVEDETELIRHLAEHLKNLHQIGVNLEDVEVELFFPIQSAEGHYDLLKKKREILLRARYMYSVPKITQEQLDSFKS